MILTIDQGTTSSRAIIFDIDGSVIDSKQEEYPLIYPQNGWVEIDPEKLLESVTNTLKNFQSLNFFLVYFHKFQFLSHTLQTELNED